MPKTYFIKLDGNMLFYNGKYTLDVLEVFNTHSEEDIFTELFETEKGWDKLYNMFDFDNGYVLNCNISNENDDLFPIFIKKYTTRSYRVFFSDVDKTWLGREFNSYIFIKDTDTVKLFSVINHCGYKINTNNKIELIKG